MPVILLYDGLQAAFRIPDGAVFPSGQVVPLECVAAGVGAQYLFLVEIDHYRVGDGIAEFCLQD